LELFLPLRFQTHATVARRGGRRDPARVLRRGDDDCVTHSPLPLTYRESRRRDARRRCSPDSQLYRYSGRCWTLPATDATDIAEGVLGDDVTYASIFNFTALFELETDPSETTDLKFVYPDKVRGRDGHGDGVRSSQSL
jgi:hypothetical protein